MTLEEIGGKADYRAKRIRQIKKKVKIAFRAKAATRHCMIFSWTMSEGKPQKI